jgi:RNA polymerase sigma-70 factor (ECF subfamily)
MTMLAAESRALENERPYLMGVAYRLLGSQSDAEDVVQEALLRIRDSSEIISLRAYLTTVVTRLCLDELRSARRRRETYVGPNLPEPVLTTRLDAPAESGVEHREDVSLAFLMLLDQLSPNQRAVFVLREVFDLSFTEIAAIIGRSEAACRKLLSRGHAQLEQPSERKLSPASAQLNVATAFFHALASGDMLEVVKLLSDDAISVTDHGGKAQAARKPILGGERVARFFIGLMRKGLHASGGYTAMPGQLNGAPALIVWGPDGSPEAAMILRIERTPAGDRVTSIANMRNPDKLRAIARRAYVS